MDDMVKSVKKAAVLAGIFLAALGVYLVISWSHSEEAETVYTSMEAPSLPVVFAKMYGTEGNRLVGYRSEMNPSVARDSLVILSDDRKLDLEIDEYGVSPLSIGYEIRSMDGERLVERTELDEWTDADGVTRAQLPIQNLIAAGEEYLLHIRLETEPHGEVHYYTRILIPDRDYGKEMMDLARDFSRKCLDEEEAVSLVTYLETTDTADNSSLGNVTLKSSFSQITWAGLAMEPEGEMQVTLCGLEGIMGQVRVTYQLGRTAEDGSRELYDVEDYYTMRWDERRIYLMDFERTTNQVFSGMKEAFSGRRILLGIGNDNAVERQQSANGQYLAFVFNRDLWMYDQNGQKAVKIFSFRGGDDSGRSEYAPSRIRILSVDDEGNVEFLVYGYMSRGIHEGYEGISICHYDAGRRDAVREIFFIPSADSFGELDQDILRLCHLGERNMLYLYLSGAVYGIDLSSDEYIVAARDLTEGSFSVSGDQDFMAWKEGSPTAGADAIQVLDLDSGAKQEIYATAGVVLRVLGFVDGDLVYGTAEENGEWIRNGRKEDFPMRRLDIVDAATLESQSEYEPDGLYIANVRVEDARIHMDRLVRTGGHTYESEDTDTIVCNSVSEEPYMEGIGWYASEVQRKVYFIQLDKDADPADVRVTAAQRISFSQSGELRPDTGSGQTQMVFYAYSRGRLNGIYTEFDEAVGAVYDTMGMVTDSHQRILWARVDRANLRGLTDPQALAYEITRHFDTSGENMETADGMVILNARGLTLRQTLYFIGKGYPVIAYTGNDKYVLLCGYDQYNVTILDPETGERSRMGLGDATEYFENLHNDFVCAVRIDG